MGNKKAVKILFVLFSFYIIQHSNSYAVETYFKFLKEIDENVFYIVKRSIDYTKPSSSEKLLCYNQNTNEMEKLFKKANKIDYSHDFFLILSSRKHPTWDGLLRLFLPGKNKVTNQIQLPEFTQHYLLSPDGKRLIVIRRDTRIPYHIDVFQKVEGEFRIEQIYPVDNKAPIANIIVPENPWKTSDYLYLIKAPMKDITVRKIFGFDCKSGELHYITTYKGTLSGMLPDNSFIYVSNDDALKKRSLENNAEFFISENVQSYRIFKNFVVIIKEEKGKKNGRNLILYNIVENTKKVISLQKMKHFITFNPHKKELFYENKVKEIVKYSLITDDYQKIYSP